MKKRVISLVLILTVLLSVFGGAAISNAAVDIQSDKAKLLNAMTATTQNDRIAIVKEIAEEASNNYTTSGNYTLKSTSFVEPGLTTAANNIWGKLGGNNSIKLESVKSGLVEFKEFYDANNNYGKFVLSQLTGTLTSISTPSGLGNLGTQIEEYTITYNLFVNSLMYLKKVLNNAEPLEQTSDNNIRQSSAVTALETIYTSIGFSPDRLTAYKAKLTDLLAKTQTWPSSSEKSALINDLIKNGVVKAYVAPETPVTPPSNTTTTPTPTPTPAAQAATVSVVPTVDSTGVAAVKVPQTSIDTAFKAAVAAADGTKTVVIEIKEVAGAKAYAPELPASVLASGKSNEVVVLSTPAGKLNIPGNMFSKTELGSAADVKLSIGLANTSDIKDEALKKMIGTKPVIELAASVGGTAKAWSNPEAPVTVSVKYTPTAEELKNPNFSTEFLTIYYIDGAGKYVEVPNARYDAFTGTIVFSTTHFSKYALVYTHKSFTDLGKYGWAKNSIEVLASKGIMNGTSDGNYGPQIIISRDEFIAGLVRATGLSAKFDTNFSDVTSANAYYNEIGIAKKIGLTSGMGNDKFGAGTSITRQDMMALVLKAMELKGKKVTAGNDSDISKFADKVKVSSYAKAGVATCVKNGLVVGSDNRINPLGNLTKAEASVIIYKMYNK